MTTPKQSKGASCTLLYVILLGAFTLASWLLMVGRPFWSWVALAVGFAASGILGCTGDEESPDG